MSYKNNLSHLPWALQSFLIIKPGFVVAVTTSTESLPPYKVPLIYLPLSSFTASACVLALDTMHNLEINK